MTPSFFGLLMCQLKLFSSKSLSFCRGRQTSSSFFQRISSETQSIYFSHNWKKFLQKIRMLTLYKKGDMMKKFFWGKRIQEDYLSFVHFFFKALIEKNRFNFFQQSNSHNSFCFPFVGLFEEKIILISSIT